jgi:Mn2+/Fe2+ NRAMP family transporter
LFYKNKMYAHYINKLGPGLLMASAAVGVSHLVQSTRAGVYYGLIAAVILVSLANLMKYPFYEYAHRYAASTGKNLLDGYKALGRGYLWSFLCVNIVSSIGAISVVSLVTGALLKFVLFPDTSLAVIACGLLLLCWGLLLVGRYQWLETVCKYLMFVLTITTLLAVLFGLFFYEPQATATASTISVFDLSNMPFIIALMGWMPASSEVAVWQSLWVQAEARTRGHAISVQDAKFDFDVGYILVAVLACLFVAIGAIPFKGQVLSDVPAEFAGQFIDMYAALIGDWSRPIVALTAIIAMFSTIFTLVDAYPRSLSFSIKTLYPDSEVKEHLLRHIFTGIIVVIATYLVSLNAGSIKWLVDLVTIAASLAMPYFAWLNMRCIKTIEHQPPRWVKQLAVIGLMYLVCFCVLFLYSEFLA